MFKQNDFRIENEDMGMSEITELVQRLPYWNDLTADEQAAVAQTAVVRTYRKNEMIYGQGDLCLGMIYVLRGRIRVYILSEDGREITLFFVSKGESCVISAACVISQLRFETVMAAEEPTELLIVSAGDFQALAEYNLKVRCFLYELATERFSQVMWVMQEILFLRFDQRLAKFFVSEFEKTGEREIRMTQKEIAQQVNSAREVVARMLRQFSEDGLVELKRGCILLNDLDGLRRLVSA